MTIARDVRLAIERELRRGERINDIAVRHGVAYGTVRRVQRELTKLKPRRPVEDPRTPEEKAAAVARLAALIEKLYDESPLRTKEKKDEP